MTILDAKLILCTNLDVDPLDYAGTASVYGDIIDLGTGKNAFFAAAYPNIGEAGELELVVFCDGEAGGGATNCVITFGLETAAAYSGTDLTSPTVLMTKAIAHAAAVPIGTEVWRVKVPAGDIKQYLALKATVSVANATSGKYSAFLSLGHQSAK